MSYKEEAEELGTDQESREWLLNEEEGVAENLSGESEESDKNLIESEDEQEIL